MNRRAFLKTAVSAAIFLKLWPVSSFGAFPVLEKKGAVLIVAHMDDEIIWFLPWLDQVDKIIIVSLPATTGHLNILNRYSSQYQTSWHFTRGITSFQDYREHWLNLDIRQQLITEWDYDRMLRDVIADPGVGEIFTHSPWGEYGHIHHRQVSEMVRTLASEYQKDVWCPGVVVTFPGGRSHSIYEHADLPGLSHRTGYYDAATFRQLRQHYINEPVNQTWPVDFWTWGGTEDFPREWLNYYLVVDQGHDLAPDSPEIQQLMAGVPVFGE